MKEKSDSEIRESGQLEIITKLIENVGRTTITRREREIDHLLHSDPCISYRRFTEVFMN